MDIATLQAVVNEWFKNQTPLPGGVSVTIVLECNGDPNISFVPREPLFKAVFTGNVSPSHIASLRDLLKQSDKNYDTITVREFWEEYPNKTTLKANCGRGWTALAVQKALRSHGYVFD